MAGKDHEFQRHESATLQRRLSLQFKRREWLAPPSENVYAGISAYFSNHHISLISISIRDSTYLLDFIEKSFDQEERLSVEEATDFVITQLDHYGEKHLEKIIGAAMPNHVADFCPRLCSRLWGELDIIPLVLPDSTLVDKYTTRASKSPAWDSKTIDEQAEAMSRKCVRLFGPENVPLLQVGFMGLVEVDTDFHVRLARLEDFQKTVSPETWAAVQHYVSDLRKRKIRIAFFSATPQGGGVALMRHALMRLSHVLDTDVRWYVPKPRPGVFQVTKKNHNILQGVAGPDERFSSDDQSFLTEWIAENARRYWSCPGGPLCPPSNGGADVIIVDDPQMPGLIPIAKKEAPSRPVIFRSHIQIRSDLVNTPGTPQAEVWEYLWNQIKLVDCFISHPVKAFVPQDVPTDILGYMPATTDWLDGLNKNMRDWDVAHYGRLFNAACRNSDMPVVHQPDDRYIAQIARFDPAKGIFDVLESYDKFYTRLAQHRPDLKPPKLLICGHGSVDDPDGTVIHDQVIDHIEHKMASIRDSICVMRLKPPDQILNAILSKATVVLQLSAREGFEVKVSEAIHKGKPVIATRAGGIPLQVEDGKNGFLVDVGDTDAVAEHLYDLWVDDALYKRMAEYAISHVRDEVSTVGNALSWFYLCSKLSQGEKLRPQGRWINDLAFESSGVSPENLPRLKRAVEVANMG
ncbi:unnamed protein product [Penicillium olsonii]|uniref:Glycosyl transferase family 1 domain-containing protein n=1 Tax=Penicillium olsonii TaxID=99116 RepID=A0A9W4HQC3_PENOL|nr:unnamed protein product [Penicillium olsonii]CAG8142803.1 unnamed protein product [Penicillium olsonii]CAG8174961.1 unnamed protein product [Penicillium olsonii]